MNIIWVLLTVALGLGSIHIFIFNEKFPSTSPAN